MSLGILDKLGKRQFLAIGLIFAITAPIVLYLLTNLANVQKDYEYLRQSLVKAEEKIATLQQVIGSLKDAINKIDKQLAIYETATSHQLKKLAEDIKGNRDILNQIYKRMIEN
jgi:septal ring factor EnvC (AmiA/AmiB activator)